MFNIFTLFLVGNIISGFYFHGAMFFILGVASIIWNGGGYWVTGLFLDVTLGLIFLSIFHAWFVRASFDFFAFFYKLGFVNYVAFGSWFVIVMFDHWRRRWGRMSSSGVIVFFTFSLFCKCKRD